MTDVIGTSYLLCFYITNKTIISNAIEIGLTQVNNRSIEFLSKKP